MLADGGSYPVACVIRDLSEQGACLEVADNATVPDRFRLLIPIIGDIVDDRHAEVRWRRQRNLGVLFVPPPLVVSQPHGDFAVAQGA